MNGWFRHGRMLLLLALALAVAVAVGMLALPDDALQAKHAASHPVASGDPRR